MEKQLTSLLPAWDCRTNQFCNFSSYIRMMRWGFIFHSAHFAAYHKPSSTDLFPFCSFHDRRWDNVYKWRLQTIRIGRKVSYFNHCTFKRNRFHWKETTIYARVTVRSKTGAAVSKLQYCREIHFAWQLSKKLKKDVGIHISASCSAVFDIYVEPELGCRSGLH